MDLGGIIMIVVLLVFPVLVLMSMAALAGLLGYLTKTGVDADHADSELLAVAEANPWATPATDD